MKTIQLILAFTLLLMVSVSCRTDDGLIHNDAILYTNCDEGITEINRILNLEIQLVQNNTELTDEQKEELIKDLIEVGNEVIEDYRANGCANF